MEKTIYCIGKKIGQQMIMTVNEGREDKSKPLKRISIISLKMVREGSILYNVRKICSPSDAVNLGRTFLEDADREELLVCCLDTKNQPQSLSVVSVGSLNSSIVHPREVFKLAIISNSASIIMFHNHPSGQVEPSDEDITITKRLKECGKLMGIELLDHIIIGSDQYCSLKEKGII